MIPKLRVKSNQATRFEFQILVDGVQRKVFGRCKHRLNAISIQFQDNLAFFKSELFRNRFDVSVFKRFNLAFKQSAQFGVLEKNRNEQMPSSQALKVFELPTHRRERLEIREEQKQRALMRLALQRNEKRLVIGFLEVCLLIVERLNDFGKLSAFAFCGHDGVNLA